MTKSGNETQRALLAGLFAPGAGQAVQGRYLAAVAWGLGFLVPCGVFFWLAARTIAGLYEFASHFDTAAPPPVTPRAMVITFVLATAVYIGSLLDIHAYSRRQGH